MVQYAVFTVTGVNQKKNLEELNAFLRSHRIYHVEKQFLPASQEACWSFCIEYDTQGTVKGKNTVDYKEVLSEKEFAVYSKLRDIRKESAAEHNVPLYAVFTNEQLAAMVKNRTATLQHMGKIEGVGESKVEHYGERFVTFLQAVFGGDDETSRKHISGSLFLE
jgi:superfamily II DNA helicase RecQ